MDFLKPLPARGRTGGASGKDGKANRAGGSFTRGAGGGAAAQSTATATANHLNVGRRKAPSRKGGI